MVCRWRACELFLLLNLNHSIVRRYRLQSPDREPEQIYLSVSVNCPLQADFS
jgi:hypothetical protein